LQSVGHSAGYLVLPLDPAIKIRLLAPIRRGFYLVFFTSSSMDDKAADPTGAGGGSGGKVRRRPGRVPTSCAECRRCVDVFIFLCVCFFVGVMLTQLRVGHGCGE
jgi:hypothetical protein